MNSYMAAVDEPLVIIANRIEAALFVKVPMVPEICNAADRLEHLVAFLENEASDENSIVFTNSAKVSQNPCFCKMLTAIKHLQMLSEKMKINIDNNLALSPMGSNPTDLLWGGGAYGPPM